jgi:hypothetical protein
MSTPPASAATSTRSDAHATNDPQYFCSGSDVPLRGEADFLDAAHWDMLADKHLSRNILPQ